MNKFLSILLSLGIVLSLAACAASSQQNNAVADPTKPAIDQVADVFQDPENTDDPKESSTDPVVTDPVEVEPSENATEPTEEPTVPTEPDSSTDDPALDDVEVNSLGYCAVGIVDSAAGTAKVLFEDRTIMEIPYKCSFTPIPGMLYGYTIDNGVYMLHNITWQFNQDIPISARTIDKHELGEPDQLYLHDGSQEYYYDLAEDCVVFARFSETEYRIFQGSDVICYSDWPCICYFATIPSEDGLRSEVTVILVCQILWDAMTPGNADETTTYYFDPEGWGWNFGDIVIE